MNIFKILANGDGTINEANVSAFLGYLLDPKGSHTLGYEFLKRFLEPLNLDKEEEFRVKKYDYHIFFEQGFKINGKKKEVVDIVIVCYETIQNSGKESLMKNFISNQKRIKKIFLIENKIKVTSSTKHQLEGQFISTIGELEQMKIDTDEIDVYSIYVTPDDDKLDKEFKTFISSENNHNNSAHIYWSNKYNKRNNHAIKSILEDILKQENNAEIEAINEYTKHTIKSFIQFISNDFKSEKEEEKSRKEESTGAYVRRVFAELNDKNLITDKIVMNLLDGNYSKDKFNINYPFLTNRITNSNKKERYNNKIYTINAKSYSICSEWYTPSKDLFDEWLKNHIN